MEANREKILEAKAKEGRSVMEQLHHTNHKPTEPHLDITISCK